MRRSVRRLGPLTFVLLALVLATVHADQVATADPPPYPFVPSATASQQAASALQTIAEAGTPAGLSASAARMASEAARAPLWRAATPPAARTVVVQEGQSVWTIASAWGVSVEAIAAANGLATVESVKPGQQLLIPVGAPSPVAATPVAKPAAAPQAPSKAQGRAPAAKASRPGALAVTLREGQTLWSLARAHGVSVESIVAANGLRDADRVRAGTRLTIPGRTMASSTSRPRLSGTSPRDGGQVGLAVRIARGFLWPARGRLSSRFGWRRYRHHDGIDIAAPYGASIYAARPGYVVFAGWYYAYGRTVIVDHGDGVRTLYAHASKLLVRTGQGVSQGQLIARVGSSGRTTGPHLHFEVRVHGRPVNPMRYIN